jgi:hypothetical protein
MWKVSLILLLPSLTLAQTAPSGGPYVLNKQVIATGGATASAAGLSVIGSVGQSAVQVVAGGPYELTGGFHGPAVTGGQADALFRNGFED